jgi:hypothetical protein
MVELTKSEVQVEMSSRGRVLGIDGLGRVWCPADNQWSGVFVKATEPKPESYTAQHARIKTRFDDATWGGTHSNRPGFHCTISLCGDS